MEVDRRTFLGAGAAGAALGMLTLRPHAVRAAETGGRIDFVVTDKRHPQSLAFGRVLAASGARRLEVTDGLTGLWREVLSPHWAQGKGAIAGMTSPAVWTALSEQALGQWRRPLLAGRHFIDPATGSAGHRVNALAPEGDCARLIEAAGGHWPQAMAQLVAGPLRRSDGRRTLGTQPPTMGEDALLLVSWKIV